MNLIIIYTDKKGFNQHEHVKIKGGTFTGVTLIPEQED